MNTDCVKTLFYTLTLLNSFLVALGCTWEWLGARQAPLVFYIPTAICSWIVVIALAWYVSTNWGKLHTPPNLRFLTLLTAASLAGIAYVVQVGI